MKILGIPYGDMDTATTRIRFYSFLNALPKEYSCGLNEPHPELIYIQKKADRETIKMVKKAKDKGVKIVYDLDDEVKKEKEKRRDKMLELADIVTTDTEERVPIMREYAKNVRVVPDCIDYEGKYCEYKVRQTVEKITTFGNTPGILSALPYMENIPIKKSYITNRVMPEFKNSEFELWEYETFISKLATADLCFLAQPENGKFKSNNRLIVCMKLGIPAIVTNSPAYRRTLEHFGYEWLIADSVEDVIKGWKKLTFSVRSTISEKFKKYAEDYTSDVSARRLAEVFNTAK